MSHYYSHHFPIIFHAFPPLLHHRCMMCPSIYDFRTHRGVGEPATQMTLAAQLLKNGFLEDDEQYILE